MKNKEIEVLKLIVETSKDGRYVIVDLHEFDLLFPDENISKDDLELLLKDLEVNEYLEIKFIKPDSVCSRPTKKGFGVIEGYKRNSNVQIDSLVEQKCENVSERKMFSNFMISFLGSFFGALTVLGIYYLIKFLSNK